MNPATNEWPDTVGAEGVKFVAQAIRDLVNVSSFESFRVMSLDTPSRLSEAQKLLSDIGAGALPKAAFEPVAKELRWSIEIDPAIHHKRHDEIRLLGEYLKSLQSTDKMDVELLSRHIALVERKLLSIYKDRLEYLITEKFNEPARRGELLHVISFYVSHLINIGYARSYISDLIESRFFKGDVGKAGIPTIRRLFSAFSGEDIRYRVFIAVGRHFGTFIDGVIDGDVISHAQLPAFASNHFAASKFFTPKNQYLKLIVRAKDAHAAAKFAAQRVSAIRAMTVLATRNFPSEYDKGVLVAKLIANVGEVISIEPLQLQRSITPILAGHVAKRVRRQSLSIARSFDEQSHERLVSALNTVALARVSDNAENKLISLWSAMEVLLSDPPPGGVRITHYAKLIVPVVGVRYPRRSLIALYNGLLVAHRRRVQSFISKVGNAEKDDATRLMLGLLLPEFNDERVLFIEKLNDNPIAQVRVRRFINSWNTPVASKASILGHENRVEWQIHRIYRARNQLVHAGRTPPYLESLVINAFEYFRNTVGPVIGYAESNVEVNDIDQAVAEICLKWRARQSALAAIQSQATFNAETATATFNTKWAEA